MVFPLVKESQKRPTEADPDQALIFLGEPGDRRTTQYGSRAPRGREYLENLDLEATQSGDGLEDQTVPSRRPTMILWKSPFGCSQRAETDGDMQAPIPGGDVPQSGQHEQRQVEQSEPMPPPDKPRPISIDSVSAQDGWMIEFSETSVNRLKGLRSDRAAQ
jgi:hypothetical protein